MSSKAMQKGAANWCNRNSELKQAINKNNSQNPLNGKHHKPLRHYQSHLRSHSCKI